MFGANAADSLGAVLCGAVQLELFLAQQQAPGQAMAAAQDRVGLSWLCTAAHSCTLLY